MKGPPTTFHITGLMRWFYVMVGYLWHFQRSEEQKFDNQLDFEKDCQDVIRDLRLRARFLYGSLWRPTKSNFALVFHHRIRM
jgi:hypothetical protein